MKSKTRKKKSKANHNRRRFLHARMCFDGIEENGQIAEFRDGTQFNDQDINDVIRFEFKWSIITRYIFKNELGFERTVEDHFTVKTPCRFNSLKDLAYEQGTRAGLSMPEGYEFDRNTWEARVIG